MRESRTYGSVRGALSNGCPYRVSIPFYPVTLKCSQMADYLPPMAPVSTNTLSWLGESHYAVARYRAFFKAREKTLFAWSTVTSAWCLADLRTKLRSVYRSQFSRNVRALL